MKRKLLFSTAILLIAAAGGSGWYFRDRLPSLISHSGVIPVVRPTPQPQKYATLKAEAAAWRKGRYARYKTARSDADRKKVLAETRDYLKTLLPAMMRCWKGTPWDFNGTAPGPGEGKIACGYFVATVLKDAGFQVDRYKLAQQPSQYILMTFLPKRDLKVQAGTPYETYAAALRTAEPGIRIVGLDHHVGFLVTGPEGFHFIHSSGLSPWCVVDEEEKDAESLRRSNYRVQGLLTGSDEVLLQWLSAAPVTVKEQGQPTDKKSTAALGPK